MYVQIPERNKCSKCSVINYTESVTRGMETFIRCRKCGHEKLVSTLTVSDNSSHLYNYKAEDLDKTIEF